jgi:SAM-dependent methyltransferase
MSGAEVQPDRESVLREWSQAAGAWRKWRSEFGIQSRAATDLIVEAAVPEPGMRVLDLASGSGQPAMSLARAVGPQGTVVATDLVPGMLLGAHQHAIELDYRNVVCAAANVEALPFRLGAFDRVTCRFGVMFFADLPLALAEVRRVLKPGRRAVFMAWGEAPRNNFFASTTGVLLRFVKSPPQGPDLAHRFARSQRLFIPSPGRGPARPKDFGITASKCGGPSAGSLKPCRRRSSSRRGKNQFGKWDVTMTAGK